MAVAVAALPAGRNARGVMPKPLATKCSCTWAPCCNTYMLCLMQVAPLGLESAWAQEGMQCRAAA